MTTSPKILTHNINCMNCIWVMSFSKSAMAFLCILRFPKKKQLPRSPLSIMRLIMVDGLLDMLNVKVWSKHSYEAQGRMNTVIG